MVGVACHFARVLYRCDVVQGRQVYICLPAYSGSLDVVDPIHSVLHLPGMYVSVRLPCTYRYVHPARGDVCLDLSWIRL
jgi:hypothetical protein